MGGYPDLCNHLLGKVEVMSRRATILFNVVMSLAWLSMGVVVICYPSAIGFIKAASTRHTLFAAAFAFCVALNILDLWFKPKTPVLSFCDRFVGVATIIALCGCL